ncbi:MAG: hypothetical protein ACI4O9_08125 [Akkermansia sp.]
MVNHCVAGRDFLEARRSGLFAELLDHCLSRDGVVHFSPACLLMGVPAEDDPRTLVVMFQHSHLPALRRVLLALPFERVRWRREFKGGAAYGTRERAVADFCRHEDFGTGLTR